MVAAQPTLPILGIDVLNLDKNQALELIANLLDQPEISRVAFLNAHCSNVAQRDASYRKALSNMVVLPDGIGIDIAAKLLHGRSFSANLNGTDFVPALLDHLKNPLKVGLYGAEPGVADAACVVLSKQDNQHDIRAMGHGFLDEVEETRMLADVQEWRPDILLVAKGVPAQEIWINAHLDNSMCSVAIGVGALFDFLAGRVSRAPKWVRTLRLEWLYRLVLEPGRLWRRYVLGNPLFLFHVLKEKFRGRKN